MSWESEAGLISGPVDVHDHVVGIWEALVVTVRAMVVDALRLLAVPVMVTVELPAVAELEAVSVSTLAEAAGLVANEAVTPVGRPVAARFTEPAKGLTSVIVIVTVPLEPWAIERVETEGLSVKLPVGGGFVEEEPPLPQAEIKKRGRSKATKQAADFMG